MMPYQYLELIDNQTDYAVHSADFYKPVYYDCNRIESDLNVVVRPRFTSRFGNASNLVECWDHDLFTFTDRDEL